MIRVRKSDMIKKFKISPSKEFQCSLLLALRSFEIAFLDEGYRALDRRYFKREYEFIKNITNVLEETLSEGMSFNDLYRLYIDLDATTRYDEMEVQVLDIIKGIVKHLENTLSLKELGYII